MPLKRLVYRYVLVVYDKYLKTGGRTRVGAWDGSQSSMKSSLLVSKESRDNKNKKQ